MAPPIGTGCSFRAAVLHRPPRRAKAVAEEVLGEHRPVVWVSDRYAGQQDLAPAHQVCLAHVLRDVQYAIDCGDAVFAPRLRELLRWAIRIGRRRQHTSAHDAAALPRPRRTPPLRAPRHAGGAPGRPGAANCGQGLEDEVFRLPRRPRRAGDKQHLRTPTSTHRWCSARSLAAFARIGEPRSTPATALSPAPHGSAANPRSSPSAVSSPEASSPHRHPESQEGEQLRRSFEKRDLASRGIRPYFRNVRLADLYRFLSSTELPPETIRALTLTHPQLDDASFA